MSIFSKFITKEIKSANNIQDRTNRHNVTRILEMISTNLETLHKNNKKGLFVFSGIDDSGEEIFEVLEPALQSKMFSYSCGSKFITDIFDSYYDEYNGSIIFASGDECIIYKFNGGTGAFEQYMRFDSRIGKKHSKGGQSALRFSRIADNEREKYVITLIELINKLSKHSNWIFGSQDIINDIFQRKNQIIVNLSNGGFLNFDKTTISDTRRFIQYMKNEEVYDDIFAKTLELFETAPDLLEFNPLMLENIEQFEYVIISQEHPLYNTFDLHPKVIKLQQSSKFYGKLKQFVCIGKYYFDKQTIKQVEVVKNTDDDDFM